MPTLNAIDESWGRLSPAAAHAHGIQVVYGYASYDTSKNLPAALIHGYHGYSIGAVKGWESDRGRPLLGSVAGHQDAAEWRRQLEADFITLGYRPRNRIAALFSCDVEVSDAEMGKCVAYYQGAQAELGTDYWAGAYGQYSLIERLYKEGFDHGLMQTIAWSGGRKSAHQDLYQYQVAQHIDGVSVDYDQIVNKIKLAAWWAPGHPLDVPEDEAMTALTPQDLAAIQKAAHDGTVAALRETPVTVGALLGWESAKYPKGYPMSIETALNGQTPAGYVGAEMRADEAAAAKAHPKPAV